MQCPSCQAQVDDGQRFCPKCGTVLGNASNEPDPLVGAVIGGKYKVVKLLGEGGMGAVYQAEQQLGTSTRKVAVKTLHAHLSRDEKVKERFLRECGTLAHLEHPNTIQVFDFGTTDQGLLYMVMEFVQGRSLADVLEKDGPMEPPRAENIMGQICGSLEEAHGRGIIHRDLKPDNVVLTERAGKKDFVKVLDFGIAKRGGEEDKNEQKLTQQGMVLGTPPYMSPEQFTGKPLDLRSDIYSLGVMAYEMLTGKLPFKANTAWEWATQHMTVQPMDIDGTPSGPRVPPAMKAAVKKALSKTKEDRYASVKDFAEAFRVNAQVPAQVVRGGTAPLAAGAAAGVNPYGATDTNPPQLQAPQRRGTEVGTPLDLPPGVMGPGMPPMTPPMPAMTPPRGAQQAPMVASAFGTPAAGNVAFPTPAGIPQAPPREARGGGGKGLIFGLVGVLGLIVVAMIVVFVSQSRGPKPIEDLGGLGATSSTSTDTPATSTTPTDTPPAPTDTTVAPLDSGNKPPPRPAPHPGPEPQPKPTASPTNPQPNPPPNPTPTPPKPHSDPPVCAQARALRAAGNPKWQGLAAQCAAQGGSI
jgi:eukaryotic-like serine/threonine-protein kinase